MTAETGKADASAPRRTALKGPVILFAICLLGFGLTMWDRLAEHSRDNHYVYLAEGMLDGRLHIEGNPPHRNDWAQYDGKWYVSFPPAPAVLMIPGVAIWGLDFNDRIFSLVFAAAAPALLLLLLQLLVARGRLGRSPKELWLLSLIYAFGTVFFFAAVQGSVWYTAHIVGSVMVLLFLICAVDARHPILAGLFLGLAFACRPPLLLAFPFFIYEFLARYGDPDEPRFFSWIKSALKKARLSGVIKAAASFALPMVVILALLMLMNWARFDDPFEFGHKHLKVIQSARIAKWGLFHYHYLAHNLGIALSSLPWLSAEDPHVKISMHGLALWFTTPVFLWILRPVNGGRAYTWIALTALLMALPSLLYQNSGWVQFGYRFSLDYTPLLMVLLALGGRRFKKLFVAAAIFALLINLFGAVTFDRAWKYYAGGKLRDRIYQPD